MDTILSTLANGTMQRRAKTPVQGINETGIAEITDGNTTVRAIYKLCGSNFSTKREAQTEMAVRHMARLFPFVECPRATMRDYADIGYPGTVGTVQHFINDAVPAWYSGTAITITRQTWTEKEVWLSSWGSGTFHVSGHYTMQATYRDTHTHTNCGAAEYPDELECRFYDDTDFRGDAIAATIFDRLIGNSDRHGFNWLYRESPAEGESHIVLIDHGAGYVFNESTYLCNGGFGYAEAVDGEEIPAPMLDALRRIANADLRILRTYGLNAAQIEAMQYRAEKMVRRGTV